MIRAALVTMALVSVALRGGAAHAGPEVRPAAAPPPDGTGEAPRPGPTDTRRIVGILELRVAGGPDE
ncbi:MAG TPA: hypothetical protein VGD80_16390, partial [Kofleriaceae bacterium]